MIILYGPDGSIVDANDLVLDHLGYTMPAIRALPAGRLHPAEEQARFDLSIDEACELGSSKYEITFVKKSGERFHAEVSAIAYSIQNRTVIQAVVHDATRRRTSEEHLAAEKERMRVTLGSMTEGVISTDNDGRIILMNEVAAQLTGADPREAIGRPVEQVFDPVAPSGETVTENPVRSVLREKKTAALRGRLVAKDRSHRERTISLTAAPLRGGDGTCLGAVVVFCDMTEALIAEEELHKVHVLQSLGLLAGGIAHDFNNFLTSIGINIGLGLATSYSIVRKHDGFMTVESQPDRGTSFAVYLPAVHAGTPPEPQQFAPPASGGGRVLLMDDDDLIRKCALSLFPEIGYRIECVTDGAAALRRFEEARACGQPFDIVVLDLTIPGGMGGRETARRLLETDPAASIVVSSGYSNDPVLAHYREYGFCDVISKPYEVEKMEKTLATIMEHRRTAPQTADAQAGP